jgi:hypothetical protein
MGAYKKYLIMMGIVWGASLLVFAAAYYLVITPQMKVRAKLYKEVTEKKDLLNVAIDASLEENKKKLQGEVELLKGRLYSYVTEYEDFPNLTFAVSRIAGDKQVSALTVRTPEQDRQQDPLTSKNLQENKMEISYTSDFIQFMNFLNTLERHQPVVFVDKFKIQRGDQGASTNKVDMSLSFFVKRKQES